MFVTKSSDNFCQKHLYFLALLIICSKKTLAGSLICEEYDAKRGRIPSPYVAFHGMMLKDRGFSFERNCVVRQ